MVSVVINVRGVRDAQVRINRLMHWKRGLRRPLAELLKQQHERRILHEKTAPDGTPWAPLRDYTIQKKREQGNTDPSNILIDTRAMAENFRVTERGDIIRLRNPSRYTIFHQEGTRYMVARPFLGISNPNVNEIRRLVERHIRAHLSNNLGALTGR